MKLLPVECLETLGCSINNMLKRFVLPLKFTDSKVKKKKRLSFACLSNTLEKSLVLIAENLITHELALGVKG